MADILTAMQPSCPCFAGGADRLQHNTHTHMSKAMGGGYESLNPVRTSSYLCRELRDWLQHRRLRLGLKEMRFYAVILHGQPYTYVRWWHQTLCQGTVPATIQYKK